MTITMKKYLIALAAMAVAVSSCTEKMSSGDNVPDGGDKVPEKTKLVKRITTRSYYDDKTEFVEVFNFSYDKDNRVVTCCVNDSWNIYWTYADDYASCVVDDIGVYSTYVFDNNKLSNGKLGNGVTWTYLYDNNNNKPTSMFYEEEEWNRFTWDEKGNQTQRIFIGESGSIVIGESGAIVNISYTDKLNKCNIALEHYQLPEYIMPCAFIDRIVFDSICSNHLIERIYCPTLIDQCYSYKFDEEGCPTEVRIDGGVLRILELEYY